MNPENDLHQQLDELTKLMEKNARSLLERGERVDDLLEQANELCEQAAIFKTTTAGIKIYRARRRRKWVIILCVVVIVALIVLTVTLAIVLTQR